MAVSFCHRLYFPCWIWQIKSFRFYSELISTLSVQAPHCYITRRPNTVPSRSTYDDVISLCYLTSIQNVIINSAILKLKCYPTIRLLKCFYPLCDLLTWYCRWIHEIPGLFLWPGILNVFLTINFLKNICIYVLYFMCVCVCVYIC